MSAMNVLSKLLAPLKQNTLSVIIATSNEFTKTTESLRILVEQP